MLAMMHMFELGGNNGMKNVTLGVEYMEKHQARPSWALSHSKVTDLRSLRSHVICFVSVI